MPVVSVKKNKAKKTHRRTGIYLQEKKKDMSGEKERGHLFVPSCAAKSLTEAILNDIGESLQSEELQGMRGKEGKRE